MGTFETWGFLGLWARGFGDEDAEKCDLFDSRDMLHDGGSIFQHVVGPLSISTRDRETLPTTLANPSNKDHTYLFVRTRTKVTLRI